MTRFSVRALLDRLGGLKREEPRPRSPRRDEGEDGLGVPVPVGPRPRRGGAQAQPPKEEEEALVMPPPRG